MAPPPTEKFEIKESASTHEHRILIVVSELASSACEMNLTDLRQEITQFFI